MGAPILPGNQGTTSLSDILTSLQNWVVAANNIVDGLGALSPHSSSGQIVATKLVQTGFVRLLGYSVISAGTVGLLYDAANVAAAVSSAIVGTVSASVGFFPVNIVFANGLVYIPGAAQSAALFYTRT